jgi:hypothetical protein
MRTWVVIAVVCSVCFQFGAQAQVVKPLVPAVSVPVEIDRGLVFIPVVVQDSFSCVLLFDSGTTGIQLFKDVASALSGRVNVQKRVLDPRDSLNYGHLNHQRIEVGGLHFTADKLHIMQRTRMPQMTGHRFDGVIGTALLDAYVVRIDYGKQRLELYDKATFEGWAGVPAIDYTLTDGIPSIPVPCRMNQLSLQPIMQIHTGFRDAMAITRRYADKRSLFDYFPTYFYFSPVVAPGHRVPARQVTWDAVNLLGMSFRGVPVWMSRREDGFTGTRKADGIIGAGLLSTCIVTFDHGRKQLYLEPQASQKQPLIVSWHGMRLVMTPDFSQCLVDDVLPGSPAEQIGIQVGDELLAVNGESLAYQSMQNIEALISGSERLIELHYRHEKLIFRKVFRLGPVRAPGPQP